MSDFSKAAKHRGTGRRIALIAVAVVLALLLAAAGYLWSVWNRSRNYSKETMFQPKQTIEIGEPSPPPAAPDASPDVVEPDAMSIEYGGRYYVPNENVVSVLFMGIDVDKQVVYEETALTGHQADTLILGVIDTASRKVTFLNIPRDAVVDVKQLDANMHYARTTRSPICIQHAFGDGGALSAQLTMEAAGGLLYGVPINQFVTMSLSGVKEAVGAVGGVKLTVLDDFTAADAAMEQGKTMTLNGKQSLLYVQRRIMEGLDGENSSRMKRQIQFCKAFLSAIKAKVKADPAFVLSFYEKMQKHLLTNLTVDEILYLSRFSLDSLSPEQFVTVPTTLMKDGQCIVDEEALKALMVQLFYVEK